MKFCGGDPNDPMVLAQLIRDIGIARFTGRIHSGLIEHKLGYEVVARYIEETENPPNRLLQWIKSWYK